MRTEIKLVGISVFILNLILFCTLISTAQGSWTYEVLDSMPEPIANNAVVGAKVDGNQFVYTFSGIDESKRWFGIHQRNYKYDVENKTWSALPDLPNGNGRIAAGASVIKNKIYVVGGYEVFSTLSERSFSSVHVLDPVTDTFLPDAADLLYPIDDHIQGVWRDSLLYIVTGWSNSTNLFRVQIYNPSTDVWVEGTPVPNTNEYKVFGGSGVIIGDTIYYSGGASLIGNFNPTQFFRKGAINPNDPTDIKWTGWTTLDARGYRMASESTGENPLWIGGSFQTYNFNGIAYNGTGGVPALGRIKMYDVSENSFVTWDDVLPATMDFRGVAKLDENNFIIAGGMQGDQEVTSATYLLTYDENSSVEEQSVSEFIISPNPVSDFFSVHSSDEIREMTLYSAEGKRVKTFTNQEEMIKWSYGEGAFFLFVEFTSGDVVVNKIIGAE